MRRLSIGRSVTGSNSLKLSGSLHAVNAFATLLGSTLMDGKDQIATADVSGRGKVVGLYFSATWCPPCQAFTPKLVDFYQRFKHENPRADDFEIIFVSSDYTEAQCEEYYRTMPWKLLPHHERDLKAALTKRFQVASIPTLLLLEGDTAKVITKDGKESVLRDPGGKRFPWRPPPLTDMLHGLIRNAKGDTSDFALLTEGKVIGLYFSASWCPPCRAFTPKLARFYEEHHKNKGFEIFYISSDRDEASFQEYSAEMPWWSFTWEREQAIAQALASRFEVKEVPTLVLLDRKLNILTANGVPELKRDPLGSEWPFQPRPVERLRGTHVDALNAGTKCCIYFARGSAPEDEAEARNLLLRNALEHFGSGVRDVFHFFATPDQALAKQVLGLIGCTVTDVPKLAMMELPLYAVADPMPASKSDVSKFVQQYLSGDISRTKLT